jgi:hypothetical protein
VILQKNINRKPRESELFIPATSRGKERNKREFNRNIFTFLCYWPNEKDRIFLANFVTSRERRRSWRGMKGVLASFYTDLDDCDSLVLI